jgi:hypothetical protein
MHRGAETMGILKNVSEKSARRRNYKEQRDRLIGELARVKAEHERAMRENTQEWLEIYKGQEKEIADLKATINATIEKSEREISSLYKTINKGSDREMDLKLKYQHALRLIKDLL